MYIAHGAPPRKPKQGDLHFTVTLAKAFEQPCV